MTYARVLDNTVTVVPPPDLLDPDDPTADGRWWDLRQHDLDLALWEAEVIGPHGWEPIVTTPRPPDTATTTHDYSVELVAGAPTEVWTERPWTPAELDTIEAQANTTQMVAEQDESVDKLIAVVEALNALTALTNAEINQNPAAIIKDLARECKTIARVANREARLTSSRTESTDTGTDPDADAPTTAWTVPQIIGWLVDRGVIVSASAGSRFTKAELLAIVTAYLNDDDLTGLLEK